eukprot:3668644-Rhodomonas_salina.7
MRMMRMMMMMRRRRMAMMMMMMHDAEVHGCARLVAGSPTQRQREREHENMSRRKQQHHARSVACAAEREAAERAGREPELHWLAQHAAGKQHQRGVCDRAGERGRNLARGGGAGGRRVCGAGAAGRRRVQGLSLIHISEPTRPRLI